MELLIFLGLAVFVVLSIAIWWLSWEQDRNYIKMEIRRSCDDDEREYWEKKLKLLYIERTPIIRWFYRSHL